MNHHSPHGVINHNTNRKTDFLYRVSMKCLVKNDRDEVLVVKENGRTWWDLPGGGMDHTETIKAAIAREMKEEVNLTGDFSYEIMAVDEPVYLEAHGFWQLRLVFKVMPSNLIFSSGEDGDEVRFIDANQLRNSPHEVERKIYQYVVLSQS